MVSVLLKQRFSAHKRGSLLTRHADFQDHADISTNSISRGGKQSMQYHQSGLYKCGIRPGL